MTKAVPGTRLRRELRAGGGLASTPGSSRNHSVSPGREQSWAAWSTPFLQAHLPWQSPSRATPLTLRQPPNPQHSPGGLVNNLSYLPQTLTGHWVGRRLQSPSSDPSTCSTASRSPSPTPHPLVPGPEQGKEIPEGPSSLLSTANPRKSLPAWSEPQSSDKRKQPAPGPVAGSVGASSRALNGGGFGSWSGHMSRSQVPSLVGVCMGEETAEGPAEARKGERGPDGVPGALGREGG